MQPLPLLSGGKPKKLKLDKKASDRFEKRDDNKSSIAGTKQIPLWVHLNFSPLQETSSQGPNQTTLTKARVP